MHKVQHTRVELFFEQMATCKIVSKNGINAKGQLLHPNCRSWSDEVWGFGLCFVDVKNLLKNICAIFAQNNFVVLQKFGVFCHFVAVFEFLCSFTKKNPTTWWGFCVFACGFVYLGLVV